MLIFLQYIYQKLTLGKSIFDEKCQILNEIINNPVKYFIFLLIILINYVYFIKIIL